MLFATKDKPKGPKIESTEDIHFDLSGCDVFLKLPSGNEPTLPEPGGLFIPKLNIYDYSHKKLDKGSNTKSINILSRLFNYSGFMGESLGTVHIYINVHCLHDSAVNLFNKNKFSDYIKQYANSYCNDINSSINDAQLQLPLPDEIQTIELSNTSFLVYRLQKPGIERALYHTAITEDCHIEIMFRYGSPCDTSSKWYEKARELEDSILSSVKIKLTDSANSAKTSAV